MTGNVLATRAAVAPVLLDGHAGAPDPCLPLMCAHRREWMTAAAGGPALHAGQCGCISGQHSTALPAGPERSESFADQEDERISHPSLCASVLCVLCLSWGERRSAPALRDCNHGASGAALSTCAVAMRTPADHLNAPHPPTPLYRTPRPGCRRAAATCAAYSISSWIEHAHAINVATDPGRWCRQSVANS
jgi:hypothetical protein